VHRIALLLLASLLLVTAAACGGDSDDPEGTPDSTATAAPTSEATEPAGDAAGALEELAAGFTEAEFSVTYESETNLDEPPFTGEPVTSEWEWVQSGELSRFDFDGGMVGFPGTMTIITTPDESFICVGQGCLGSPPDLPIYGSPSGPLSEAVMGISDRAAAGEVTETESREIAGAQARCFEFTGADASGTVCLSESGVPLHADIESESGALILDATEYSETVDPTAFEPPYDVTGI
jgi:hypothetical protein